MHHDSQFRSEAERTGTNTCYRVDELWKSYPLVTKPTCSTVPLLSLFFEQISIVRCLLPLLYHPVPPGEGSSKAEFWLQMSKFIKHGASKKKQDRYPGADRYHYQRGPLHIHQKWENLKQLNWKRFPGRAEQFLQGWVFYPSPYHRHFYTEWLTTLASLRRDIPSGCTQGCNVFNIASCLPFSSLPVTGPRGQPDPGQKFWRTLGVNTFKCEMKRSLLNLRGHFQQGQTAHTHLHSIQGHSLGAGAHNGSSHILLLPRLLPLSSLKSTPCSRCYRRFPRDKFSQGD